MANLREPAIAAAIAAASAAAEMTAARRSTPCFPMASRRWPQLVPMSTDVPPGGADAVAGAKSHWIGDGDPADDDVDEQEGIEGLQLGVQAFRSNEFDVAIQAFSGALKSRPSDPAIILSNRSVAFCRFSERLREIPATASERKAIYGLDPMSLAQLGLKDAEKLLKLRPDWPKAHLRKGKALQLLERYEQARETYLNGLHLEPASAALQAALKELKDESGENFGKGQQTGSFKRAKMQRSDELDCTLCLKLLYNPVTTPCGHSFCRACLLQAMDHGNKCPMCRVVLFVNPKSSPVSVTLNNLIQHNFPDEYKERKAEMDQMTLQGTEVLPLFVMSVFLPGENMPLNIFEPRYRLMVRRIMEGNRRMGMVGINVRTGVIADIACEVEICECEGLPDGRFYLEVEGRRRCKIVRAWEQDGYRVAQVQWVQDRVPVEGSPEQEKTKNLAKEVSKLAEAWIARAKDVARRDQLAKFLEFFARARDMPDTKDAETFSFWIANFLQLQSSERLQFLNMTDTHERLYREMELLSRMMVSLEHRHDPA